MVSKFYDWVKVDLRVKRFFTPKWLRVVIILAAAVFYVVVFRPVTAQSGPVGAALVALPVVMAGFFFGIRSGLAAGVLGVILSTTLLSSTYGGGWFAWLVTGWPGNVLVLATGYVGGLVSHAVKERFQAQETLTSRERFLSLISMITREMLEQHKRVDAHYQLIAHLTNLFIGDYGYLISWDETAGQAKVLAANRPHKGTADFILTAEEANVVEAVIHEGRPLVIADVQDSPFVIDPAPYRGPASAQSALVLPLSVGNFKFGVAIIAFDTRRRFSHEELTYAELASSQIALAIWTTQQNAKITKKFKEAVTLANIERILSETEQVGLETILQTIVDSAKELIPGAQYAVLHILDAEQQVLVPSAVSGFKDKAKIKSKFHMRLGEGIAGQAVARREIISVPDTHKDERFMGQTMPARYRSLLVAPIQSNDRCVGTISIQSEKPHVFTEDESQLLGSLGTQAAIAIENSSLFETTQRNLKEINALYLISRNLAASLDPDELMKTVVNLLADGFGYYFVQIFTVDPETGDLVLRQGSGGIGEELKERRHRLPVGSGIVGHVAETLEAFVTNDAENVVFFIRNELLPDTNSEMTIPIKVEGQLLGILDIQQNPPAVLSRRDLQLSTSVADQLAVVLQKANLYTELQSALNQEKMTRSQLVQSERLAVVGRLLASVSHELNNPLQAIQNVLFLLQRENLSEQGRQDMELILSETERMAGMIDRLRSTYRPTRSEDFQPAQLNRIIEDVHALTATHLRHQDVRFEFLPDRDLPQIACIPEQIKQVVLNLVMNAVEAMPSGGTIKVITQTAGENQVLFQVSDTGVGIAPDVLPHIFEPFITNKEMGTGLGLTITYDIIQRHRGVIRAENNPKRGATFTVWLPQEEVRE